MFLPVDPNVTQEYVPEPHTTIHVWLSGTSGSGNFLEVHGAAPDSSNRETLDLRAQGFVNYTEIPHPHAHKGLVLQQLRGLRPASDFMSASDRISVRSRNGKSRTGGRSRARVSCKRSPVRPRGLITVHTHTRTLTATYKHCKYGLLLYQRGKMGTVSFASRYNMWNKYFWWYQFP